MEQLCKTYELYSFPHLTDKKTKVKGIGFVYCEALTGWRLWGPSPPTLSSTNLPFEENELAQTHVH